jgi:two-component system response regulator DegU
MIFPNLSGTEAEFNKQMESYISYNRSPEQLPVYSDLMVQMINRVLIVDDSRQMRELIKMTLKGVAEVAGECADGADALNCYEEHRPDWVLMDWEMRTDGLTATRRIIKAHPQARILIVTNYDDDELRTAAIEAGARGFVLKDDLLALGALLERR